MKLFFVAGEASGDARGAELMRALRARHPRLEFLGAGGPQMKSIAGGDFLDWADEAVVGLWDVLKKYGYFKEQFDRMLADLARIEPDALILIDYPGFNLRLAKAAKDHGDLALATEVGDAPSVERRRVASVLEGFEGVGTKGKQVGQ